jgi:hypothetical protein
MSRATFDLLPILPGHRVVEGPTTSIPLCAPVTLWLALEAGGHL